MVSLVFVSHSALLAEGVRQLAEQMTQGAVPMAVAGGIDDPDNPIGTDAMKVLEAIQSVYSDDGVVVLMDLGSALLSAEMALEFLSDEQRPQVHLCPAPLVEGALAAAVQASVGASAAQVMAEALGALAVKVEHMGGAAAEPGSGGAGGQRGAATEQIALVVRNRLGLHARPAARLVSTAGRFTAEVTLLKDGRRANAKSINQVATLGVRHGDTITVSAGGPDATAALAALQALADDNFGDREEERGSGGAEEQGGETRATDLLTTDPLTTAQLKGIPASPGVAIGPAALYRPRPPEVVARAIDDAAGEWRRLRAAVDTARDEIDALHRRAVAQVGADEAAIFEAHLLFLQDPLLVEATRDRIYSEKINAEAAWQRETAAMAATYREMADDYMRARAADVEDVAQRVLRGLMGVAPPSLDFAAPAILIAADLTPSDTARLDRERVLAVCTELGGATAHSAILARALGIPAVVGLGHAVWQVAEGQHVAVDGNAGALWLQPDEAQVASLTAQREAWLETQRRDKAAGQGAAATPDGRRVEIAANVGSPNDVAPALEFGAEGVGLFRTEFLFMDRAAAPSEEEQFEAYRRAARAAGGRPLIIRTLDVGGDKPLPYLDLGEEANPFLGWRAIRFCLERPDVFMPQLRAILRASAAEDGPRNVKLMLPMIGAPAEVHAARAMLATAQAELRAAGVPYDEGMEVGIMIEVPSAVAVADQLARLVDFFSIGTNDLTQYVMAADRGNARVAELASAFQPAVLRMVRDAATAAHDAGIWIGMCGELAGNPLAAPVLVGLGLDELSMSAPSIPAVKAAVRRFSLADAQRIAAAALALDSAEAVARFLQRAAVGE
jgi:phosphoenolpyruvate-protein phosphotransferase/dihydroxyacetone kinase phosphotransfer subunit